jgi:hypothetical protein
MRSYILVFLLFTGFVSTAQNTHYKEITLSFTGNTQRTSQNTDFEYTAIALYSDAPYDFSSVEFISNDGDVIVFSNDNHPDDEADRYFSNLIHLNDKQTDLVLQQVENISTLGVALIDGSYEGETKRNGNGANTIADACEEPNAIDQSDWRAGLPAPNYNRTFTDTENVIVHHAAGSNTATDFRQVVRDIYIFHTESRGWSDIGYNYLVAQDGTIFKGRDPADGRQDLVMGAHFCGSNSTTMGICTLGNYNDVEPSGPAIEALIGLIAWKVMLSNLDPTGTDAHPLNNNLGVIAGHRDGCDTSCPGEYLYDLLGSIRVQVADQVEACENGGGDDDGEDDDDEEEEEEEEPEPGLEDIEQNTLFPNPVNGGEQAVTIVMSKQRQADIENIYLFDQNGRRYDISLIRYEEHSLEIFLPQELTSGMYLLTIITNNYELTKRVLIE